MTYSIESMRAKYMALHAALGGTPEDEPGANFERLAEAYSGPRRKYHTLEHIYWVLKRVDEMADDSRGRGAKFEPLDWDTLRWAAWYHDYVLNGSPNDEGESASFALCAWPKKGPARALEAFRLVMATSHDRIPLDHQAARICDADLSILAADPEHFDRYESQVREEWAHVPDELFKTARAVILKRFVDRPWIYMTDYGRTRWERRARQNLARSMAALGSATR